MAADAALALRLLLSVFGVAALAVGVLRHGVQALQARRLVAAATGGRAGRAVGTGGTVAVVAGGGQPTVRRACDGCMTGGTRIRRRRAAVRLVTAEALLVSLGRASL